MRRSLTRPLVAGVAAVTVAVAGLVAGGAFLPAGTIGGPQAASAESGTCGKPIKSYDQLIGVAPDRAIKIMTDNHYNEQLGSVFGDNELLCGITRAGIDAVAGQVV